MLILSEHSERLIHIQQLLYGPTFDHYTVLLTVCQGEMGHKRSKSNFKRTNKITNTFVKGLTRVERIQARLIQVAERTNSIKSTKTHIQDMMDHKYLVSKAGTTLVLRYWLRAFRGDPTVEVSVQSFRRCALI